MKLFYITFSIRGKSGLERMIVLKANYFAKHYKYDVNVLTIDDYFDNNFYPLHQNITHHDLKLRDKNFLAKSKEINKVLSVENPDIVLVAMDNFSALFQPLFLNKKFPMVLERHSIMIGDHNSDSSLKAKLIKKAKFRLMQLGAKSYDKLVVLSEGGVKEWGNLKNIIAINNPKTFSTDVTANLNNKKVLAIGRFDYIKGFDMLLEIWHKIATKFPEWELHIYGYGNLQQKFEKLVINLGLTSSVTLHPPTKNILDIYLNSSIYTMTSRNEGFPLVILEAMTCGLPVISFDCPIGPRDIITDKEDGFLIPVGNIDVYTKKLTALMDSAELRQAMGRTGRQNIARLNPKVIMAQWNNLFEELTKYNF